LPCNTRRSVWKDGSGNRRGPAGAAGQRGRFDPSNDATRAFASNVLPGRWCPPPAGHRKESIHKGVQPLPDPSDPQQLSLQPAINASGGVGVRGNSARNMPCVPRYEIPAAVACSGSAVSAARMRGVRAAVRGAVAGSGMYDEAGRWAGEAGEGAAE